MKEKLFTKVLAECKHCPNVCYVHFDGEGESCDYQYNYPYCSVSKPTSNDAKLCYQGRSINYIGIPDWCPLDDFGKDLLKIKKKIIADRPSRMMRPIKIPL